MTATMDVCFMLYFSYDIWRMPRKSACDPAAITAHWRWMMAISIGVIVMAALFAHRPDMRGVLGPDPSQAKPTADMGIMDGLGQLAPTMQQGMWIVILYRSSCPHCQSDMPEWLEWAALDQEANHRRWALVNVDDANAGDDLIDRYPHEAVVHLRRPMATITTPQVLVLKNGGIVGSYPSMADALASNQP